MDEEDQLPFEEMASRDLARYELQMKCLYLPNYQTPYQINQIQIGLNIYQIFDKHSNK